jgi:YVTN family beta-propeller protein
MMKLGVASAIIAFSVRPLLAVDGWVTRLADVARIAPDGSAVVATVPLGATRGVAVGTTGVAVTNPNSASVFLIDVANGTMKPVGVGLQPAAVAYTPDGRSVVVANAGDDTLTIVDVGAGRVGQTVKLGSPCSPNAVAVSSSGDRVFVTCGLAPQLLSVNTTNGSVLATKIKGLGTAVAVHPSKNELFVADQGPPPSTGNPSPLGHLARLSGTHPSTLLAETDVARYPSSVAIDPAGTYLVVACRTDNLVRRLDPTSLQTAPNSDNLSDVSISRPVSVAILGNNVFVVSVDSLVTVNLAQFKLAHVLNGMGGAKSVAARVLP